MYKLAQNGKSVIRLSDNAYIPFSVGNRDYVAYQEWLAAGNAPQPAYTDDEFIVNAKAAQLAQVDTWTAAAITGGFASEATGVSARYDSEQVDQDNIKLMHAASLSPTFDTDPTYQGQVPIRAVVDGATEKTVLLHNRAQLQTLIDDMARHIGACKKRGWELQAAVAAATTAEEVAAIGW